MLTNADVEESVDDRSCPRVAEHEQRRQMVEDVALERVEVGTVIFHPESVEEDVIHVPRTATDDEETEDNEQHFDDLSVMTC